MQEMNELTALGRTFVQDPWAFTGGFARTGPCSGEAYLTALTDAARVTPSDDLLSGLVHISGQPGQLWPLRVRILRSSWH